MSDKPHLLLHWVLDIPNQQLVCKVNDQLTYIALNGGHDGFIKKYNGVDTELTLADWVPHEKLWISKVFGEQVGYYQPDSDRVVYHPITGHVQYCVNGVGPDGQYLDHLQRMQILMEGKDQTEIWGNGFGLPPGPRNLYSTPDKGMTVYKRTPAQGVRYPEAQANPDLWWFDHPQPCAQQPYSKGYKLSSHAELLEAGCPKNIVDQCKAGQWASPEYPELQAHYIYPKTLDQNPE